MDNTAKNTDDLTWSSKKERGSVRLTHRAEANGWKYAVDQPTKGEWVLRGWGPYDAFLYRDGFRTMKAAKAGAEEHATDQTPKAAPVVVIEDEGAAVMRVWSAAAQAAAPALHTAAGAIRMFSGHFRRAHWVMVGRYKLDGCTCPTPTHRMSCGHGATPKVVGK